MVADRGMISEETINELDQREIPYILGARMRKPKEIQEEVLPRAGRFLMSYEGNTLAFISCKKYFKFPTKFLSFTIHFRAEGPWIGVVSWAERTRRFSFLSPFEGLLMVKPPALPEII